MKKMGNIRGLLHSYKPDRIVVQTRNGFAHIFIGSNIQNQQRWELEAKVGTPCSVWATKDNEGKMHLMPNKAFVPMTVPRENRIIH